MKRKMLYLLAAFSLAAPVSLAVSASPAVAVNDPGMEGAGGGCPGHVEWNCYQTFGGDNIFGDLNCFPEWVRDC